jgi:hypothetical protein
MFMDMPSYDGSQIWTPKYAHIAEMQNVTAPGIQTVSIVVYPDYAWPYARLYAQHTFNLTLFVYLFLQEAI